MDTFTIVWIVIMIGAAILEISTQNLVSIWFSGGAIIALLSQLLGVNEVVQCVVFVLATACLLMLTRPLVKRMRIQHTPTNADRIIGQEATVIQDVTKDEGQIIVYGMVWSARSNHGVILEKNTKVRVVDIKGVKAIVEPLLNT